MASARWAFLNAQPPPPRIVGAPRPTPTPEFGTSAPLPRATRWSAAQRAGLRRAIANALAPLAARSNAYGAVVLAQDGQTLYADRADAALTPASTQKLVVAAAALHLLGPAFRFRTLVAVGKDAHSGDAGSLYVVGSGDPTLVYGDLLGAVKVLKAKGVRTVERVVVDGSAIGGPEINSAWNALDLNEDFEAATSGISLDQDTVEFHIAATLPRTAARVWIVPPSDAVRWYGTVLTAAGEDVTINATQLPNRFVVGGGIPAGEMETQYLPIHGIAQYVGHVFERMLRDRGISVRASASTGIAPLQAQVAWNHPSPTVRVIVGRMLFQSNNHFAEQLLRALGGTGGAPANDADGIEAERHFLRANDIPAPGLHLVDGSGLAYADRIAPATLARMLLRWNHGPYSLYPLLPRDGKEGTLRTYRFAAARGRVRAKSGHLDTVGALAGYVDTHTHGRLVFAFIFDASRYDTDAPIEAAVDRIARY